MNSRFYMMAIASLIATTPAVAQTATNPDTTTNPGTTDSTTPPASGSGSALTPSPSTSSSTTTGSSEPPVTANPSPVEPSRLDPSAPSEQRLIIDPGSGAGSTTTNPADNSSNPGAPGSSYNAILENGSSSNGASTGSSGLGVTPAPSALSPSMYPRPLTTPSLHNPASNYPAALTAPVFPQPSTTTSMGIGPPTMRPGMRSGLSAHSTMQSHPLSISHAHAGSHR